MNIHIYRNKNSNNGKQQLTATRSAAYKWMQLHDEHWRQSCTRERCVFSANRRSLQKWFVFTANNAMS